MKCIYLFSLLMLSHLSMWGQTTGTVRGTVRTSDGNPAPYVNIAIAGTTYGAVAGKNGNFEITRVSPGNYVLVASFVGLQNQRQQVEVKAGETTTADFVLNENTMELEEVIVSGGGILNTEDDYVAKMPMKKLENPQVYSGVSAGILKQQAITNFDDAFRNIPGVSQTLPSTGRAGDGAAFFALRGLEGQPALVNGLPGITNGNLDPANIEEIQVMKGPSATLFGGSATAYANYGGVINTITKKPYFTTGGEIAYNMGSFGLNRITADINTPLRNNEKTALRVNTAYHTEGSFQDAGFKKSFFIAPSLAYEVNDKLKFLIVTEILEEERAVAPVFFHSNRQHPLTVKNLDELNLNNDLSFTNNDLSIKNPRTNLQAQMVYKLSDKWTSQTVISRGTANSKGYYTYIWPDANGNFGQFITYENESRVTTDIQQNFNADLTIGNLRNRLLIGFDYFNQQVTNNGLGYGFIRNVTPQGGENFIDSSGDTLATVFLSRASIDNLLSTAGVNNSKSANGSYSAYISDVINITPAITVLASLRADYFDSKGQKNNPTDDYDQFALSPKFGVVYQPVLDKVSLFANYQNSFHNIAPQWVTDVDGESNGRFKSFEAEQANQWEVGVKTNVLNDKLFATASYYDIKVSNGVHADPLNQYDRVQGGEISSKGYELDITANLFQGFNLIAGYSHNETKNVKGLPGDFYEEPGSSPGGQGPEDQFNLWATYVFHTGDLKNLGVGFGGNYAGENRVIDNSITGTFDLPAYTVLNGTVFYTAEKFRLALNVNNITDKAYYTGYWSVNPQKPRNFVVTLAYKF